MQSYEHFTIDERTRLQDLLGEGKSKALIARILQRSPSSIYREIARNANKDGTYHYWRATSLYLHRRKKSRRKYRLAAGTDLQETVREKLTLYWPPECISERLKRDNPGMRVSFATIYRAIRRGCLPGITAKEHLRRRGKRKYGRRDRFASVKPDYSIHDRDPEANDRSRVGDWEGDTVQGKNGCIVTLVDRYSRMLCAQVSKTHSSDDVKEALLKAAQGHKMLSLTLDNGSEFAKHREFSQALGVKTFFADPHSPWQRPTNENTNGLLRFFFPRGSDFSQIGDDLHLIVDLYNDRPRKCLGWLSPNEILSAKCCT
jgi:IS30 family transposase